MKVFTDDDDDDDTDNDNDDDGDEDEDEDGKFCCELSSYFATITIKKWNHFEVVSSNPSKKKKLTTSLKLLLCLDIAVNNVAFRRISCKMIFKELWKSPNALKIYFCQWYRSQKKPNIRNIDLALVIRYKTMFSLEPIIEFGPV